MHSEEAKVYIALLIAAGILGFILLLFILSILQQQKKTRKLHFQKIHAEIKTLESERRRIARDLHDDVAVLLSAAKLKLSAIESETIQHTTLFSTASDHIDEALIKLRRIAKDLMPITLERKGLVPALQEFFVQLNESTALHIDYTVPETDVIISRNIQVHVFRIVQEVVHNAIRHSEATELQFYMAHESSCMKLYISDNGKGFDQNKIMKDRNGFGLHTISSRVEILNGAIYLDTAEGKGVAYNFEIPLTSLK